MAPIPVIGIAETGAFRPMVEFGTEQEDLTRIFAPRSRAFPSAKHFTLEIRGDSMNAARPVPLVDGMFALCVDIADAGLTIESGRIYAVRRTLDNGQTYEVTIKRAKVFRDRIELSPESTNARHKPAIIRRGSEETNAQRIEAVGLVYGVFSSIELS
jgi:SOS-response transcriptional repressor LexA